MTRSHKNLGLALFVVTFLAILYAFSPSYAGLYKAWQTEEYSHGFLIPLIALLIGAHKLSEVKPVPVASWTGIGVLLAGFLFLIISQLSAFEPPSHYGLVIALMGMSLAVTGNKATKILLPAFIYLFFAVPLPRLIYVNLSSQLQLISSTLGVLPLQWLGLSVYQEGNVIDLGEIKLQVVEACSGLRYLFPLMSFGYLVAVLYESAMWKRVVIFLSTVPITVIMNALRISVIGVTVNLWGVEMAEGLIHDFEGWVVFAGCLLFLAAEIWLLGKIGKTASVFRFDTIGLPKGPFLKAPLTHNKVTVAACLLSLIFAGMTATNLLQARDEIIPPRPALSSFPLSVSDWKGRTDTLSSELLKELDLTDYWLASYSSATAEASVDLYIAYYESQRIGASIHSPMNCLPGDGWRVESQMVQPVKIDATTEIPATRLLIKKGKSAMLVYYWMDQRGRILNDQYESKWYLFVDSITKHRTDGALVRLTTPVGTSETIESAETRIQTFLKNAYPSIRSSLPQ